ncbi:MAG: GDP-L-fucose synthase [Phycisphaera sp.]|nr:MAG: GDP-L-fucose synthase [Phycisphaera sp.]
MSHDFTPPHLRTQQADTSRTDLAGKRVVVTGGSGFLGSVVVSKLQRRGASDIIVPRSADYDLTTEDACKRLFDDAKPDIVLHLAAEVGGIGANRDNPGRYFFANMSMAMHLIEQARINNLEKFVQVGTICAYPKDTPVPFTEENLWEGYPEETNAPYGVAKKAAMTMLDAYRMQYSLRSAYVLPVNLYGPNDNFNLHSSHVIPALIRKCVEAVDADADSIDVWGTGSASREFLYVDDAAEGIVRAAETMNEPIPINLGASFEVKIKDLVELIARLTGFAPSASDLQSKIRWDSTKPDGQPRRCLDTTRAKDLLCWQAEVGFEEGLSRTIEWFRTHRNDPEARM